MSMGNTDIITNAQIYDLLQRTSQDILSIKQDVASYKQEIDNLKNLVETLEGENHDLKQKLSFHEDLLRKKNIVIFGLLELENKSLDETLLEFFKNKLQINVQSRDLDIFYRIGKNKNGEHRPILVKFLREFTVQLVFKNVHRLKGTGISVAKDQTYEKRTDNKILYEFLKIAKEKQFPAKIFKSTLVVGDDVYTVDILRNLSKNTFLDPFVDKTTLFPNTSAPPTPTISNEQINSSSDGEVLQIPSECLERKSGDTMRSTKDAGEASRAVSGEVRANLKSAKSKILLVQTPAGRKTRNNSTNKK